MITLSEISKAYGSKTLFTDATIQLNRGDRVGLVGPNGAGKTTLFNMILGLESPDSGEVIRERNVRVGHLPQESAPAGNETVLELATAITPEFIELRRQVLAFDAGHHDEGVEWHDDLHNRFNDLGGYQLDAKDKGIL